jgi:hypothetical protein
MLFDSLVFNSAVTGTGLAVVARRPPMAMKAIDILDGE